MCGRRANEKTDRALGCKAEMDTRERSGSSAYFSRLACLLEAREDPRFRCFAPEKNWKKKRKSV